MTLILWVRVIANFLADRGEEFDMVGSRGQYHSGRMPRELPSMQCAAPGASLPHPHASRYLWPRPTG